MFIFKQKYVTIQLVQVLTCLRQIFDRCGSFVATENTHSTAQFVAIQILYLKIAASIFSFLKSHRRTKKLKDTKRVLKALAAIFLNLP